MEDFPTFLNCIEITEPLISSKRNKGLDESIYNTTREFPRFLADFLNSYLPLLHTTLIIIPEKALLSLII